MQFSIVVPAYNAETTLAETLDAVIAQTFRDWECVVVDDGSVDTTRLVAAAFAAQDGRIRVISQRNQGSAGAYNSGVRNSEGDFIVICSADDLLLPEHLVAMAALIDANPDCGIYSSNGEYLYDSGLHERVYRSTEWSTERSLSFGQVLSNCFFSVGAVYPRWVFNLVGGYRTGVYGEDYDLWLRAMARGAKHLYTPQNLAIHRVSDSQKSADLVRVFESNIEIFGYLLDSHWVEEEDRASVEKAIRDRRRQLQRYVREQTASRRIGILTNRLVPLIGPCGSERLASLALKVTGKTEGARDRFWRWLGR